mgnify:CR=1 FL=1
MMLKIKRRAITLGAEEFAMVEIDLAEVSVKS